MAWTLEDQAASYATDNASSTTWNPWTLNVAAGLIIFTTITVTETPGTTMPAPSKPGGETNSWVELSRQEPAGGGAAERTRLWGIKTTVAWNHALTFTFGSAKQGKIANYTVFSGGSLVPRLTPAVATRQALPWASASTSIAFSGQSEAREGDLVIGFQTNGTPVATLDADTTNGVWVNAGDPAAAAINAGGEDFAMRMSYKITTGRGTQTLNGPESVGAVVLCPKEAAHVITEGGDIDSGTAHPDWYFRTAAAPGPNNSPMKAADLLIGGTHHKQYNTAITTPATYTKFGAGKTDGTIINQSTQVNAFEKVSDGTDGATVVITTTGGIGAGSMQRLRGGAETASEWDTECVFGADTNVSGTSVSITADNSITVKPGDKILYFLSLSFHDCATGITIGGLTGCTFTQYDVDCHTYITDPDGGIQVGYVEIDDTPSSAPTAVTPTLSASYNSGASAAPAAFVRVTYLLPAPDQPQDVACGEATSTSIQVTWENPGGEFEPTYFEVYIDEESPVNVGLDLDYTFTGLDPNTTHAIYVRACNESQCGGWVEVDCSTCPPVPVDLTATDVTPTGFTFCWEDGT